MRQFIFICVMACLLTSCAAPKVDTDPNAKYPIVKVDGKKYRRIPAEDYLMRTYVPVPPAPNSEETSILVDLPSRRAWLYKYGMLTYTCVTCPGKVGHETPTGTYKVIAKHKDWTSTLYHVPMPHFLRLNAMNGEIGLHQGPIALEAASHGCIRLPKEAAEQFFNSTPVGTTVVISNPETVLESTAPETVLENAAELPTY